MPTLILTPSLALALQIKTDESCPHIHFVEDTTSLFVSSLCWVETLVKGADLAKEHGVCVVSYERHSAQLTDQPLSTDELSIILSQERQFLRDFMDVEIWESPNG